MILVMDDVAKVQRFILTDARGLRAVRGVGLMRFIREERACCVICRGRSLRVARSAVTGRAEQEI